MAYQPLWVIYSQSHAHRRTGLVLFKPLLRVGNKGGGGSYFQREVNIMARTEFEPAYKDVERIMGTSPPSKKIIFIRGGGGRCLREQKNLI